MGAVLPPPPAPPLTLHHLTSSHSMRVLWALEELSLSTGLEYNLASYDRWNAGAPASVTQIFPHSKLPVLEVPLLWISDDGSSSPHTKYVQDSRIIIPILAENYANGNWTPTSDEDTDRDFYFQDFAISPLGETLDRLMYFQIAPLHFHWAVRPLLHAMSYHVRNMIKRYLDELLAVMEGALSDEKPWFAGANLGVADFIISWPMDLEAQRGLLDEKRFPKVADWLERVHARPAYQNAVKMATYDLVGFEM